MRSDLTVVQSQLQSKGLSQLDYFVGTPHDELPQLFFREVTGLCSPDYPRSDDVDRQNQQVSRPLQNYSEQTAFEKQDLPCIYLAHYVRESRTLLMLPTTIFDNSSTLASPFVTMRDATDFCLNGM